MITPMVAARAGGNVGIKQVHHRYTELVFVPLSGVRQSRLLDAQIFIGEQVDPIATDDWFISAEHAMPVRSDYMVRILAWKAPAECLRALVDTGKTIEGRSRAYYFGEIAAEPVYVEIRSVQLIELNDGTVKRACAVVPRCYLWHQYQTWHDLDGKGLVLVHDLVLRVAKTVTTLEGLPLEKVPEEGIFWYSDLTDWVPPKARIYDVRQLRDAQDGDVLGEEDNEDGDDSPDAISGSSIEPAGRGY